MALEVRIFFLTLLSRYAHYVCTGTNSFGFANSRDADGSWGVSEETDLGFFYREKVSKFFFKRSFVLGFIVVMTRCYGEALLYCSVMSLM